MALGLGVWLLCAGLAAPPRVLVLDAAGDPTAHAPAGLETRVRRAIDRDDAETYPGLDFYQAGRKEPDRGVGPEGQRARVGQDVIDRVNAATAEAAAIEWSGLTEEQWAAKADELRQLEKRMWFVGRPELREPLFGLYLQIGRAADYSNNPVYPYFGRAGDPELNWYWYLAGVLASREPRLAEGLDPEFATVIDRMRTRIEQGAFPSLTVSFAVDDRFAHDAFGREFKVVVNGLEREIDERSGQLQLPAGRFDLYLERSDGYSMSERVELAMDPQLVYYAVQVAQLRSQMLARLLVASEEACRPDVDDEARSYLAIYAALHPDAEVWLTVGKGKDLWRWDRASNTVIRKSPGCG